jgi:serine/threonine protein kinase
MSVPPANPENATTATRRPLDGLETRHLSEFGRSETATWPSQSSASEPPLIPPGYRLVRELGRGGMGRVYQVVDESLDATFALKMILTTGLTLAGSERFRNEARAMVELDHPNIVRIYSYAEFEGSRTSR